MFYGGYVDVGFVSMAIHQQIKVDWMYVRSFMEYPLLSYECYKGSIEMLQVLYYREGTLSRSDVVKWFVRLLPAVHTSLSRLEVWTK